MPKDFKDLRFTKQPAIIDAVRMPNGSYMLGLPNKSKACRAAADSMARAKPVNRPRQHSKVFDDLTALALSYAFKVIVSAAAQRWRTAPAV